MEKRNMDISELTIRADAISAAIESVDLSQANRHTCEEYSLLFGKRLEVSTELDDSFRFLAIVCGWRLRPDDEYRPFDCVWQTSTWNNLTESQLDAIGQTGPLLTTPELRARLCDIVWLCRRTHAHARTAAVDYITSAESLVGRREVIGVHERVLRAAQLASRVERHGALFEQIVNQISRLTENPEIPHCTVATCLDVLLAFRGGDASKLHKRAVDRARGVASPQPNPIFEQRFWNLAAGFAAQNEDAESRRAALLEVAKSFERQAQASSQKGVAAHFWEMALQTYRKLDGTDSERERAHRELLNAQEGVRAEMISVDSGPINITELVTTARKRVVKNDKRRSIAGLVLCSHWLTKDDLQKTAEDFMADYPFQHMFPTMQFGSTGKVAAKAPPAGPLASETPIKRLVAEMCKQYRYFIPLAVSGTIEPMCEELLLWHAVSLDDFAEFVCLCPYLPIGREHFFVLGLHAGLHGRYIEALHVLIPQLEHLVRDLLRVNGKIASRIKRDGIQEECDLNQVLNMEETEALIGKDLCFALRVLFTERFGFNLRNELSHGMLAPASFYSPAAVYAWWLLLRIVAGPLATSIVNGSGGHEESSPGGAAD
jgi:hypothetical protein